MTMSNPADVSDEDLRIALFEALVEDLNAKASQEPSLNVVNRMPTSFAVSKGGNLLTLSQGIGVQLLRGDLKSQDRRVMPRTFKVSRATIPSKLAITPDHIEGTPDQIIDWIVTLFLEPTAGERPAPRSASAAQSAPVPMRRNSGPTAHEPQHRSTIHDTLQQQQRPAGSSERERRAAPPRIMREIRLSSAEVARVRAAMQKATSSSEVVATAPPPAPIHETTTPTLRTYQLLFETAQRELDQAQALTAERTYFLISAGVFVAFAAEAFFNDLGSRVIPSWSQLQRLDPREKAEVLSLEFFNDKVDWGIRPFQSIAEALGFRRALAYAHTETLSFDHQRTADRQADEVPRTRRTTWREYCDVVTIQRWVTDVRLMIEHFSKAHDPTEVAIGTLK